jgi:hypothetical protein
VSPGPTSCYNKHMHNDNRLRIQAFIVLGFFALQFLVGMVLNFFVELPDSHPGAGGGDYISHSLQSLGWSLSGGGGLALTIHAYVGLSLCIGALVLFTRSLLAHSKWWSWMSGIAALFTIDAFLNGVDFASTGKDEASMAMAMAWLIAVALLVVALARRPKTSKT